LNTDYCNKSKNSTHEIITSFNSIEKIPKIILNEPDANFNNILLTYINKARNSPKEFSNLILECADYILKNPKISSSSKYVFFKDKISKIGLKRGKPEFCDAAALFGNLWKVNKLELDEDLCITIPDNIKIWTDRDYLMQAIENKRNKLASKYEEFAFHFDLGTIDPKYSVLLQLVDDNDFNYQRRYNIMNPYYNYIGITSKKIENQFCVYLLFAR